MSIRQPFLGIIVLATSCVIFAQTTETKPPDVGSGAHARQSVEILTDTMGVDFGPYMMQIVKTVRQNWYSLMPPSVYPPVLKQGKVSIEFVVLKDGTVSGMKVDTSSGNVPLDRAAWGSITASTPFHVLPTEFPGERFGLRFYFSYNPERVGDSLGSSQPPNLCHFSLTTISVSHLQWRSGSGWLKTKICRFGKRHYRCVRDVEYFWLRLLEISLRHHL